MQLLRAYRRLEAQGHIRGGRFVAGVSGEQYALPDAVGALRSVRKRERDGDLVSLSAADPLNLAGIVTPGARVAALAGNRLLLRDGVPIATYVGGEVQFLSACRRPSNGRRAMRCCAIRARAMRAPCKLLPKCHRYAEIRRYCYICVTVCDEHPKQRCDTPGRASGHGCLLRIRGVVALSAAARPAGGHRRQSSWQCQAQWARGVRAPARLRRTRQSSPPPAMRRASLACTRPWA